jgi:hypothetical protein
MVLLFLAYFSVLIVGEYSFMNFSIYSKFAQNALRKRARQADDIVKDFSPKNRQEKATKLFMDLKSSMGSFNSFLFPCLFLLVALFALFAFILSKVHF